MQVHAKQALHWIKRPDALPIVSRPPSAFYVVGSDGTMASTAFDGQN